VGLADIERLRIKPRDSRPSALSSEDEVMRARSSTAVAPPARIGVNDLEPMRLSTRQLDDIELFLRAHNGTLAVPSRFLRSPTP